MKFLHTSDLHLGKSVHEFSMLEDQRVMLHQILGIAKAEAVDAVVIAGDVYDRSIPSGEAVMLLDAFLSELAKEGIPVLLISGNHDSAERLGFMSGPLTGSSIYIAGGTQKPVRQVTLQDDLGPVHFFLLPFCKPAQFGAGSSEEAVRALLAETSGLYGEGKTETEGTGTAERETGTGASPAAVDERRVLVTHFFVTAAGRLPEFAGAERDAGANMAVSAYNMGDNATVDVGGIDNIDVSAFEGFDYVALGHIHKAQQIGTGHVYYSGAPLAYSFGEAGTEKSVQIVTLREKGQVQTEKRILRPRRKMRVVTGTLEELLEAGRLQGPEAEDYLQVKLTDKAELIDPIGRLRSVYPNVMQLVFAGRPVRGSLDETTCQVHAGHDVEELFARFYLSVRGEPLNEEDRELLEEILQELETEEEGAL